MKKVVYIVCSICIVLILIFCARRLFINKKGILLTAEMINFGSTDSAEDYWKKRVYNVYYDGAANKIVVLYSSGCSTIIAFSEFTSIIQSFNSPKTNILPFIFE